MKVLAYVVRHGETKLNEQNRFRGPLDIPLSPKGLREARTLGNMLKPPLTGPITHTNKKRSEETAKEVAKHQEPPSSQEINGDSNLQAWNLGDFGGEPKNDSNLKKVEYYVRNPEERVPGGESLSEFRGRVRPVIEAKLMEGAKTGVPPILVVHSSVIHEIGMMIHGDHKAALVEPGGAIAVTMNGDKLGTKVLLRPNMGKKGGLVS